MTSDLDELVRHALRALRDCLPSEVELDNKNTCVSLVGENTPFTTYENEAVDDYLKSIDEDAAPAMDVDATSG